MSSLKRQKGAIMLIDLGIGLVVVLFVIVSITMYLRAETEKKVAEAARERVEFTIDRIQQHYMDRMIVDGNAANDINNYPSQYNDLITREYIEECSDADARNHLCVDLSVMPWGNGAGEDISISRRLDSYGYPEALIEFNIDSEPREKMQRLFRGQLNRIPGYVEDASGNVSIRIPRPGQAMDYDNLVSRDGERDMTGTSWNYGGTATLDNVVDMSFTGITDRTAISGLLKNGSVRVTSSSGTSVAKPSCPDGYHPTITTYVIGVGGNKEYTELGNIDTWYVNGTSNWTVHLRFAGLDPSDSSSERAWHYNGSVGYFTWCDL
ncbi:hypothetical protein [Vibrio agarivorans]|uniref:Type II secretion system protein n=1 Tax=Vibrio agarivorans TaxID=153622 RepID=A0ABT7Y7E5_9VIBR|nr:hypothetical protein [Vibrio agarivorans]MDN2483974.1 hypothetical protein [Vibrio agarivorans]